MQKLIKTFISNCPEDTIQFAKDLSKTISYGSTIFMIGDLGSGKTTFTKGFAAGLVFKIEPFTKKLSVILFVREL